jgi:hypothetical protein
MFKILSRKKDHKNKNPFLLYKSSRYNINSPDINQYWNDLVSKQHTCTYTVILYTLPWQIMELYDICFITFNHTSQESHDVAEILLKLVLNTNQSINHIVTYQRILKIYMVNCMIYVLLPSIQSHTRGNYIFTLEGRDEST